MATVTPQMVKQLRDRTDQPMGLCKQALDQSGADMDAAILWLQKQNKNMTAKREGNEVAEGRVGVFVDNAANVAGIVEMRCESAPSAKSDQFVALANDLARHVAAANPADVATATGQPLAGGSGTVQERIDGVVGVIREKMVLHKLQRLAGNVYGGYVHHDGTVGVVFEAKGAANDELLKDVATHIAALNPPYATVADVPADVMAREKDLVAAELAADPKMAGKPAQIVEKISADKLTKRLADIVNVLTEQQMANEGKYPKTTVGAALKKAGLEPVRFVRYKVGAVAL
ncbi:MAG: translation elongation factor Ts [Gemmataceae bacterium]